MRTRDPHMHTESHLDPHMHTGIAKKGSPYAYGDLRDTRMHTGIIQSLTVCIWEKFPYGKSSLVSPYAKFSIWGSLYAYGDLSMHTVDPSMHTVGNR
jgi:hypothetical protein